MKKEKKQELFKLWEKNFYDKYSDMEELEEEDFKSIAIGFFVANGCNIKESCHLYEYCITKNKF